MAKTRDFGGVQARADSGELSLLNRIRARAGGDWVRLDGTGRQGWRSGESYKNEEGQPAAGGASSGKARRRRVGDGLVLGIGDDCALLRIKAGEEMAVTTDLSIEGRHFRLDWHPPESVGHRTLARGLSDLAAMGARPVAAFLSLGLPRKLTVATKGKAAWVDRFFDGLLALAAMHRVPLAGGDLSESPLALADIVLIGALPKEKALLRSGAKVGDGIFVTGSLGGAAVQLAAVGKNPRHFAKVTQMSSTMPHLYPIPRVQQGLRLRGLGSAAMDLSDGLSTDLAHLCRASGVAAKIEQSALPLGPGADLEMAISGGEDYELLFTAPTTVRIPRTIKGVSVTKIGTIIPYRPRTSHASRITLLTEDGPRELKASGWEHFS